MTAHSVANLSKTVVWAKDEERISKSFDFLVNLLCSLTHDNGLIIIVV